MAHPIRQHRCQPHGRPMSGAAVLAAVALVGCGEVATPGHDLPAVRAAYGTLEMAQSLLSRDEMTTVLKKIFSQ